LSIEDKLNYLEQPIPPAPVAPAASRAGATSDYERFSLLQTGRRAISCSYVLKMKGYIDNLECLGHPVTLGLGVSLILISLRKEYDGFVQNYNMHNMEKTVNELHAMLKLHEQTLPKSNTLALNVIRASKVQKGHRKRNCPQYLAELIKKKKNTSFGAGGSGIFVIELNTILNRSWIYDTGCGTHICNTTQGLKASRKLKPGALSLYVGNGQRESVKEIGAFYLCLTSGLETVLNNCHYAPSITRGVISVSRLYEDGFVNRFVDNTIQQHKSKLDLDSALLWHCRLGNISKKHIEKLQHDGLLSSSDLRAFEKRVSHVCGPFKIMSRQGASYFITFTDDFSRYGYVYLLKHKHEVFETFKVFQKKVENQLGKTIKSMTTSSANNSVFRGFFEKQKLTRPNFSAWYRQLRIVLSIEDKLNYLEQPIPPALVAPAGQHVALEILAAHNAWIKGSKEIVGLMLMTMEPDIQRNLKPLHAHEMLRELKTLFAQQAEHELLQTTRDFHSCRQEERQSNYNMHIMGKIVNELHAMLKLHEQPLPKNNAPALNVIRAGKVQKSNKHKKSQSQMTVRGQNHGKGKNKQAYAPKPKISPLPKRKDPIKDSICHECGETGHWKRICPQYLAELLKKKKNEASGAGGLSIFGLRASKKLKPGALSLYMGNGQREAVEAIDVFYLCLPSGLEIVLNNCHYASSITRGVIFVFCLYEDGFFNRFVNNTIQVSRNNMVYFSAIPRDGIFKIDLSNSHTNESSIYAVSTKRAMLDLGSTLLWHFRLGHISKKHIEKLQHDGLLDSFDLRAFKKCVSCMSENKVLVARNAEFLENSLINQEASGSLEDLEIIQEEDTHPSIDTSLNHEENDLEIDEPGGFSGIP
nr:hypothetical protein [Tanacetum cinerariifolium]